MFDNTFMKVEQKDEARKSFRWFLEIDWKLYSKIASFTTNICQI